MFSAAKMSVEASDVQTDEDCEELAEDGFSFSADILEKRTGRKRSSGKPPPSPRSPYLTSMNMNRRRAAVAAWRLPRASLGDTRGDTPGESGSARLTSLSNGFDAAQTLRSECDVTAELLKQTLSARKPKHLHAGSNGSTLSDPREKEDMYDEIIHLKKSLQAQKSDNQQMKAKIRRLEEEHVKREKQIEELLDPTKGSEYTRCLVDKKKEGSVVINGLKQRILKLEQQCREKENALSKLQSDLRTTSLEELKITVETYFEEIQRLRLLLDATEKSSRAVSKCSQRQQKALSSTVHRLSDNLKSLQQENVTLREELSTESPAGGLKGYREWSKQRLLRRLLEVEKRLHHSRGHAQSAKAGGRLDREVQTAPTGQILGFAMATEAVVSVGTMTEEGKEFSDVEEAFSQSERERAELEETLTSKEEELSRARTEREELERETDRWKAEQTKERDKERQQHQQELDELRERIRTLEDGGKPAQSESALLSATPPQDSEDTREGDGDAEEEETEKAAAAAVVIQTNWREHRKRDIVMLQSAIRGHLLRESLLKDLLKAETADAANHSSVTTPPTDGELDAVAVRMIQSAFRGHLTRSSLAIESSSGLSVPFLPTLVTRRARSAHTASRTDAASLHQEDGKQGEGEDPWLASRPDSWMTPKTDRARHHRTAESAEDAAADSDDSDDIIVSPSRPLRSREVLML